LNEHWTDFKASPLLLGIQFHKNTGMLLHKTVT